MRIGDQLWIGEPGEPPQPRVELGFSEMDPCDLCGATGRSAWISADWPGTMDRAFDLYFCRQCLMNALGRTYPGDKIPTATKPTSQPDRARTPGREGRPRRQSISTGLRFFILKRDRYRCQICGVSGSSGIQLDIDHRVPIAKGGSNIAENLWVLCSPCNSGKRADDL